MTAATEPELADSRVETRAGSYFVYYMKRRPAVALAFAWVGGMILLIGLGELVAPYASTRPDPTVILEPPSAAHPFGTDISGFDILSRILAAPRWDIGIALSGVGLALLGAAPLGIMAGFYGGERNLRSFSGEIVMRIADIIQAFPVFILALGLVAVLGPSAINVAIAVAFVNFPVFLRLLRSEALTIRERSYVDAARATGQRSSRIMLKYVGPNAMGPAVVQTSVSIGFAIILTAGLSFVGAGVRAPTPEWGSMIAIGAPSMVLGNWWPALFPGLIMGVTILAFAVVGQHLETVFDPRRRI